MALARALPLALGLGLMAPAAMAEITQVCQFDTLPTATFTYDAMPDGPLTVQIMGWPVLATAATGTDDPISRATHRDVIIAFDTATHELELRRGAHLLARERGYCTNAFPPLTGADSVLEPTLLPGPADALDKPQGAG